VNLEFPDGATGSFTMSAFTPMEHRQTRLMGTHGYLEGNGVTMRYVDFRTGREQVFDSSTEGGPSAADGHGGGDEGLTEAFLAAVAAGDPGLCPPTRSPAWPPTGWCGRRAFPPLRRDGHSELSRLQVMALIMRLVHLIAAFVGS